MKMNQKLTDYDDSNTSRRINRKYWTKEEDQILKETIKIHGQSWKIIAEYLEGRNASQCAQRWKRIKPNKEIIRLRWEKEEDEKLKQLVAQYNSNWSFIAQFLPHRTGRQIRERYTNHLDPAICQKQWTHAEDLKIWKMYQQIGSKWAEMAKKMKGRPENKIKNRFYGYILSTYANQTHPYYVITEQRKRNILPQVTNEDKLMTIEQERSQTNHEGQLDSQTSINTSNNHIFNNCFECFSQLEDQKNINRQEMCQSLVSVENFLNLGFQNQHFYPNSEFPMNEDESQSFSIQISEQFPLMKTQQDVFEELKKPAVVQKCKI